MHGVALLLFGKNLQVAFCKTLSDMNDKLGLPPAMFLETGYALSQGISVHDDKGAPCSICTSGPLATCATAAATQQTPQFDT